MARIFLIMAIDQSFKQICYVPSSLHLIQHLTLFPSYLSALASRTRSDDKLINYLHLDWLNRFLLHYFR